MSNLKRKIFEGDTFLTEDYIFDGNLVVTGNLYVDAAIKVRSLIVYGSTVISVPAKDIEASYIMFGGDAFVYARSFNVPNLISLGALELIIESDEDSDTCDNDCKECAEENPHCDCCENCLEECSDECPCLECDLSADCSCEYCPETCPYEDCPLGNCVCENCPCGDCPVEDCNCKYCPESCPFDDECPRETRDEDCYDDLICDENCPSGCADCGKCQPNEE